MKSLKLKWGVFICTAEYENKIETYKWEWNTFLTAEIMNSSSLHVRNKRQRKTISLKDKNCLFFQFFLFILVNE